MAISKFITAALVVVSLTGCSTDAYLTDENIVGPDGVPLLDQFLVCTYYRLVGFKPVKYEESYIYGYRPLTNPNKYMGYAKSCPSTYAPEGRSK